MGGKKRFQKVLQKKHVNGATYKNNMQNTAQASSNLFSAGQKQKPPPLAEEKLNDDSARVETSS
jgi:hypothetical protein